MCLRHIIRDSLILFFVSEFSISVHSRAFCLSFLGVFKCVVRREEFSQLASEENKYKLKYKKFHSRASTLKWTFGFRKKEIFEFLVLVSRHTSRSLRLLKEEYSNVNKHFSLLIS